MNNNSHLYSLFKRLFTSVSSKGSYPPYRIIPTHEETYILEYFNEEVGEYEAILDEVERDQVKDIIMKLERPVEYFQIDYEYKTEE